MREFFLDIIKKQEIPDEYSKKFLKALLKNVSTLSDDEKALRSEAKKYIEELKSKNLTQLETVLEEPDDLKIRKIDQHLNSG